MMSVPKSSAKQSIVGVLPQPFTKTVHLIRHGEAFSNVHGEKDRAQYKSPEWFDADLSERGWKQAEALGRHISAKGIKPDVVIVSPLTRALQTASAAFCTKPSSTSASNGSPRVAMMAPQDGVPDKKIARPELTSEGAPPFVAYELCREYVGLNPCDRRRSTAHLRKAFPGIDWSLITLEEDTLFPPDSHESEAQLDVRVADFLAWLVKRPEQEIAVVSHSKFLNTLLTRCAEEAGDSISQAVKADMCRWPQNCELRSIVVTLPKAEEPCSSTRLTHWPGGHDAV